MPTFNRWNNNTWSPIDIFQHRVGVQQLMLLLPIVAAAKRRAEMKRCRCSAGMQCVEVCGYLKVETYKLLLWHKIAIIFKKRKISWVTSPTSITLQFTLWWAEKLVIQQWYYQDTSTMWTWRHWGIIGRKLHKKDCDGLLCVCALPPSFTCAKSFVNTIEHCSIQPTYNCLQSYSML